MLPDNGSMTYGLSIAFFFFSLMLNFKIFSSIHGYIFKFKVVISVTGLFIVLLTSF